METRTDPFYTKLSQSLIAIVLILILLREAQSIFIPLTFACLLAMLLITPCDYLEKKGIPRGIAALISLLSSLVVIVLVLYFVSSQIISFQKNLPALYKQFTDELDHIQIWIKHRFHMTSTGMRQLVNSAKDQTLSSTGSIVGSTVSSLSNTVLYAVLIPIYAFLLLLYRGLVVRFLVLSFLDQHKDKVYEILNKMRHVIKGYIVGLLIEMTIVARAELRHLFHHRHSIRFITRGYRRLTQPHPLPGHSHGPGHQRLDQFYHQFSLRSTGPGHCPDRCTPH